MTIGKLAAVGGFIAAALPSLWAEGPKQSFSVTSAERFHFRPGGTVRFDNSYGYLSVEGWDEPEVELTVTKSTQRYYKPEAKVEANQRLELVRVSTERRSESELSITTTRPSHGVTVDYRVRVPHDSRLVIRNRTGYIWVSDVTNDIEARSHAGDMTVVLSDPGPYSIDARTRTGSVFSDFDGKGGRPWLAGSELVQGNPAPARRVYLRMGIGGIEILKGPAMANR